MRTPVSFSSETQFEQCVQSLRAHLVTLGAPLPEESDMRNIMARIAGYDTADEVFLALREAAPGTSDDVDLDTFIYTINEHQLMLQGRCESPGLLWRKGVDGFEDELKLWRQDVLARQLGMNNPSFPVDVRCVEADAATYFVATLNLNAIDLAQREAAYRMMDHFVTHQAHSWPGLHVALRMVDRLIQEAGQSDHPESSGVLVDVHNVLASGKTMADAALGEPDFMVATFGEDMGPHNVRMIFGGNRLKHRKVDVKKRHGSTYASDNASLAQAAARMVVEDTWRAMMQTLSLTLTVYEQVGGESLSASEFVRLARKNDVHLRRHMIRAFFLGHVPSMDLESVQAHRHTDVKKGVSQ